MLYFLQYGKAEEGFMEAAKRGLNGGKLPDFIEKAPTLRPGLEFFLDAFHTLSTCRPHTMNGPGPIPWDAIERFADARGIMGEQREALHYNVRLMDVAYLNYVASKNGGS